jgi:hypothetical protein
MNNPRRDLAGTDIRLRGGARLVLDSSAKIADEEGDWEFSAEQLRAAVQDGGTGGGSAIIESHVALVPPENTAAAQIGVRWTNSARNNVYAVAIWSPTANKWVTFQGVGEADA